jgi:hypothetical protein
MARMLRPKAVTLPERAVVPPHRLVTPPPTCFTHRLVRAQPFYFDRADDPVPAGRLAAGTEVVLLSHGSGRFCRVVDGRGLHVETAFAGLEPIAARSGTVRGSPRRAPRR